MKLPRIRIDVNIIKIAVGVVFSLAWGKIMYLIWPQPLFLTFVLFYLIAGSVIVKWVFFEIIDRISLRARLKAANREIDESDTRVHEVASAGFQEEPEITDDVKQVAGFARKLSLLEEEILAFGNNVKTAMSLAFVSLEERNEILAAQVIEHDTEIDKRRYVLEGDCMELIKTGSANDAQLFRIIAMLDVVSELERMGDYAEGIAKITLMIGKDPHLKLPVELHRMANSAIEMLEDSLDAFKSSDAEKAKQISSRDDQVDGLYDQAFRHLVTFMIEHPQEITKATWLVWAAHNLERFADRVTNICERVVFSVSGEIAEVKVSKY